MAYATIREILSEVNAENPPAPEQFPDFNPEDVEAWSYFIYVYLDSSQSDFGRPLFLPKYSITGEFQYSFLLAEKNPFLSKHPPYDAGIKAAYLKKILDYIKVLTRGWVGRDKTSLIGKKQVMGFDLKGETIDDRWTFFLGLYNRAMSARDIAWRKIMTYCATLIGKQDSKKTKIILPELVTLFTYVEDEWNKVFGQVANLVITSGYRTPAEQSRLTVRHSAQTAHAVGGAIDVQPKIDKELFDYDPERHAVRGYLAWLFRVIGNDRLGKVPYTLIETGGNNVVHVSYAYLLYVGMKDEYKEILPGFLLPYDDDLPHTSTGVKREMQGPNTITEYWNRFDENTFDFNRLKSDVYNLIGAGAVSASWLLGLVNYLKEHKEYLEQDDQIKLEEINVGALRVQSSWSLP